MKILITGGAGFIGSHTAERCLEAGHEVRIVDDFSTGRQANLAAVEKQVDLIEADIRDLEAMTAACGGIEAVVHLAAVSSVEKSIREPLLTHAVNATGSLNVLEAARRGGVRRVIFSSSAAVYGDNPNPPYRENATPRPCSPYAWHKLTGEFYGDACAGHFGLEFASLRFFNVYGPRQDPDSPYSGVLSIFAQRALSRKPLIIHGDGRQTRDFIHVSDVAGIVVSAAEASGMPPVMNVGTGMETSILDAAAVIEAAAGGPGLRFDSARVGDVRRSCADIGLLKKTFGCGPGTPIREGLQDLLRFAREHQPAPGL